MKKYIAVIELDDDEEIVGDANISYTYRSNGTNYGTDESVELKAEDEGQRMKTYEDGLNESWEAVKKIMCIVGSGLTLVERGEIFGETFASTILENYTAAEAIAKLEEYENRIKVGDEVVDDIGKKSVVVRVSGTVITIIEGDGTASRWEKEGFKKTGRHFPQIAEVLKQMQEGNE